MSERKLYRLKCSFAADEDASPNHIGRMAYEAGKRFIKDMEKMGYELHGGRLHLDPKPRPHIEVLEIPARHIQDKNPVDWYVQDLNRPTGLVDHILWGYFIHKVIPIEVKETA